MKIIHWELHAQIQKVNPFSLSLYFSYTFFFSAESITVKAEKVLSIIYYSAIKFNHKFVYYTINFFFILISFRVIITRSKFNQHLHLRREVNKGKSEISKNWKPEQGRGVRPIIVAPVNSDKIFNFVSPHSYAIENGRL